MGASECCQVKRVVPEVASRPAEPWHAGETDSAPAPVDDSPLSPSSTILKQLYHQGRKSNRDAALASDFDLGKSQPILQSSTTNKGTAKVTASSCSEGSTGEGDVVQKTGEGDAVSKTRTQAQRVEDNDESDFVRGWDIATRLVALLDGESSTIKITKSERGNMTPIDASGLTLTFPITFEEAEMLRFHYVRNASSPSKGLKRSIATELLHQFSRRHEELRDCAVVDMQVPRSAEGRVIIVGDTHGQLQDVLFIFQTYGPPTAHNVYLFNGDIADRGTNSCEIFFLLFAYFLADPASVFINRGNHENEDMNALEAHCGGGFRQEVLQKYDHTMYLNFVDMMKVLPLCTVVAKKVLVVHGGLTRHTDLRLDDIRALDHTICTMPSPYAEKKHEQMWVDLLWADPMDDKGVQYSQRGVGIRFGPDVTGAFMKAHGLEFMIRSHQLPDNDKGYMKQAGKKCITIFSASNYCGDSGNHGAVLVFMSHNFPEYDIFEHYAPSLEELVHRRDWKEAGQALKERQKVHIERVRKSQELYKMMAKIIEIKPHIWSHFLDSTGGMLWINYTEWVRILSQSIGSDWSWETAWNDWNLGDHEGRVNFRNFLERFTVSLSKDEILSFKFRIITCVYESIMNLHGDLQETLRLFDQDGDGMVDIQEMRAVLGRFDLSLSHAQLDSLLHTLFINNDTFEEVPKIATTEFLARFTMVYKEAGRHFSSEAGCDQHEELVHEAMSKIGHLIAATSCEELGIKGNSPVFHSKTEGFAKKQSIGFAKKQSIGFGKKHSIRSQAIGTERASPVSGVLIAAKLRGLFEALDEDHNGMLEMDEFVRGISSIPGIFQIEMSNGTNLNEELIRELAHHMGKRGRVSILELLEAFCFEDAGGEKMSDCLAEQILSVIFRHRQPVRAGAWCFDRQGTGCILKDQFLKVLLCLNKALEDAGEYRQRLMEAQVIHLCEALSVENDEGASIIRYEEFFDSFEIVDRENPSLRVKLGHRTKK